MKKSPLALVKERFSDKAGLVKAVEALAQGDLWIDRVGSRGLVRASNAQLLKLHDTLAAVKKEFGTRAALIDAVLSAEKRSKDVGLRARLEGWSTPRLYDAYKAASKRAKASARSTSA
jgi:hypothetical protein